VSLLVDILFTAAGIALVVVQVLRRRGAPAVEYQAAWPKWIRAAASVGVTALHRGLYKLVRGRKALPAQRLDLGELLPVGLFQTDGYRILVVNPVVPIRNEPSRVCIPSRKGHCSRIVDKGLLAIGNQAFRPREKRVTVAYVPSKVTRERVIEAVNAMGYSAKPVTGTAQTARAEHDSGGGHDDPKP
jgi:hypothetical protein